MSKNTDFVNYYEQHNLHLIRITMSGEDARKQPKDANWQNTPLDYDVARQWCDSGNNLGWAVGPDYLVIDIDLHREKRGDISFDRLLTDLEIDKETLLTEAPVVTTGSGGFHVYLSREPSLDLTASRDFKTKYPGVDIQTGPKQVIIPGSTHPNDFPYLVEQTSHWPGAPSPAPPALLELLTRAPQPSETANRSALYNCATNEQCASLLSHNDPSEHADYDEWIARLAAIHHATGGAGLGLAIEWSARDPRYADTAEPEVTRKWATFDRPHDSPATIRTLISDVHNLPEAGDIIAEIEQEIASVEFDDLGRLEDELLERADLLPGGGWRPNHVKAKQIILESLELDAVAQARVQKRLARELGIKARELDKAVTAIRREEKAKAKAKNEKIPLHKFIDDVRDETIKTIEASGKRIIRAPNEQYYLYNGQYWIPQSKEQVTQLVHNTVHRLMASNTALNFETTSATVKGEKSLCSEVLTNTTDLYQRDDMPSVINTTSGTIWIDELTGKHELKPHSPDDLLTTQIATPYEPDATCPCFDTMLEQVFAHIKDDFQRSELIRHFWELIGYVIQPRKDIPLILFWFGAGLNGKSTMSNFLSALVGPMCSQPVEMHKLGSGRNNHALENLEGKLILIDDDMRSDARLSDGLLKKFSESKLVEINPKYQKSYSAKVNVTPIILINGYPIIRDLSKGLQRRIDVLPFESDLTPHKDSSRPRFAREREMSGILNRALEGLRRLRARGDFARPQCSIDASDKFFKQSNNVANFVNSTTIAGESCDVEALYQSYRHFCDSLGEVFNKERFVRFHAMIEQLGYVISENRVQGLKMVGDDY